MGLLRSVLGRRVFGAEQPVRGLVLLNGREAAHGGIEAVVNAVVIALADLAQEHIAGAGLHLKVVVQPLGDVDALAGGQADLGSGGDCVGSAVRMDGDVGSVVDGFIRQRELYTRISTFPPPRLIMSSVLYQWK